MPGSSSYDIDFHMRPMLNLNENKEIYYGRIRYKKKILWFIPVNVNFTKVDLDQPSGILPFDTYGGGWFDPENVIDDLPSIITDFLEPIETHRYNFIPTASALDAGRGTTALNDLDYRRDYVGANPPSSPKDSSFDNFVTHFDRFNPANTNSEHISFNRRNGNWLVAELTNDPDFTDCSFACSDVDLIINDDIICSSSSYAFSNNINITSINIIQGNNLVNIFGLGSNTLTISPQSLNAKGVLEFSFTIGNQRCGNRTFTKKIYIGKPLDDLSMISSGGFTLSTGNWYQLTAMHQNFDYFIHSDLTYEWQIPYSMIMFSNDNRIASVQPTQLGTYPYKLRTENLCGCSSWITRYFEVTSSPGGGKFISPAGN